MRPACGDPARGREYDHLPHSPVDRVFVFPADVNRKREIFKPYTFGRPITGTEPSERALAIAIGIAEGRDLWSRNKVQGSASP